MEEEGATTLNFAAKKKNKHEGEQFLLMYHGTV